MTNKKDKIYLLKLIILAESDRETYRYLKDHQDVIPGIEASDFSAPYKNFRIDNKGEEDSNATVNSRLEVSRKLIQMPPLSTALGEGRLAKLFYLVGLYEEPTPDPIEFLGLSMTKPEEAVKYLEQVPTDWSHYVSQLTPEVNRYVSEFQSDPAKLNDQQVVTPAKNVVKTILLAFGEYGDKDNDENKDLFKSFFNYLLPLDNNLPVGDKLPVVVPDETNLFKLSLVYSSDELIKQYLSTLRFSNVQNFIGLINGIDTETLKMSEFINPIFEKTLLFLETNFNETVTLVKEKQLMNCKHSENLQAQLVSFFTTHGEPQRTELFNLFKEFPMLKENMSVIIDDILSKNDLQKLLEVVNDIKFKSVLTERRTNELKNTIIINGMNLNEESTENFLENLWENHLSEFRLLDTSFVKGLIGRIKEIQDLNLKNRYIEMFIKKSLIEKILTMKAKEDYIKVLNYLYDYLDENTQPENSKKSQLKGNITRFIKKLKGGVRNARRTRAGS